jgi:predicted methyltransferase
MDRRKPFTQMLALAFTTLLLLSACARDEQGAQETQGAQDEQAARMRTALAAPERAAENKARDAGRKPIETVEFLGIETGDTVIDMVAAAGWFTEVLSAAVGPTGKVYSQNPPFLVQADAEQALHARLGNVEAVHVPLNQTSLAGTVDAALTAQNLHDLYNGFGGNPGSEQAAVDFLKAIYDVLKPGGVLGVIDHVGIEGQDNATMHRMQVQQARDAVTKAGFTIEAESSILANPADDHTKGVFDPAIRGSTDQFMIRARKPE